MARRAPGPSRGDVALRDVTEEDLPVFFEYQLDSEANRMAAFTAEGRMPLQAEPEDPAVRERLAAFTERYGYEFAELPPS